MKDSRVRRRIFAFLLTIALVVAQMPAVSGAAFAADAPALGGGTSGEGSVSVAYSDSGSAAGQESTGATDTSSTTSSTSSPEPATPATPADDDDDASVSTEEATPDDSSGSVAPTGEEVAVSLLAEETADELSPLAVVASGNCGAEGTGSNLKWSYDSATLTLTFTGSGSMADYAASTAPWYSYRTSIVSVVLPSGLTTIGSYAFQNLTTLSSATLPSGLVSIGQYAFYGTTALSWANIPGSVTSVGTYAFGGSGLSSVTISEGVTSLGISVFWNCTKLSYMNLPSTLTTINPSAFTNCSALTEVVMPAGLTTIGASAFYGCSALKAIEIPARVTTLGANTFNGCSSLVAIKFSCGTAPTVDAGAFTGVAGVGAITYPLSALGYTDTWKRAVTGLTAWSLQSYTTGGLMADRTSISFPTNYMATVNTGSETVAVSSWNLLTAISATLSGANASQFSFNTGSLTMSGGTLTVTYAPQEAGSHSATLTLRAAGAPEVVISLTGAATANPVLSSGGVTSLSFGNQIINTSSATQSIAVSGTELLGTITATLGGTNAGAFVLDTSGFNTTTGGTIKVRYVPTAVGSHTATLTLASSSAKSIVIVLSGSGVNKPTLSSGGVSALTFASQFITTGSAAQTITVSGNSLQGDITATLSGAGMAAYTLDTSNFSASTGGTLALSFRPTAVSSYGATLTLASPGADSVVINLSGTGINKPVLASSASSLSFADQIINTATSAQTITVSGSYLQGDITATLEGSDSAAFTLDTASFSAEAGGAIKVTFKPTAASSYAATLTLSSPNAESVVINLSGAGVNKPVLSSGGLNTLTFANQIIQTESATQTFSVSGTHLQGAITATLGGAGAAAYTLDTSSFDSGAGGTLGVIFKPSSPTSSTATLTLASPNAESIVITLNGAGVNKPALLSGGVSVLTFTDQIIETTSVAQTIAVTGTSLQGDITATLGGANPEAFALDTSGFSASAGGVLKITYTPTAATSSTALLTLTSPNADAVVITLNGTGVYKPVLSSGGTAVLAFGNQIVNTTSAVQSITVSGTSLQGSISASLGGAGASAYTLDSSSFDESAGGTLTVSFRPTAVSNYAATLTLSSTNAESIIIPLSGVGVDKPTLSSGGVSSLAFTSQIINTASAAQTFTITGTSLQGDITWALSGAEASAFRLDAAGFNANSGGTFRIYFTPTAPTSFNATLTLASQNAESIVISLSGTGIPKPSLSSGGLVALSFADQIIEASSTEQTLTVTGANLLGDISVTLEGTGAAAYTLDTSAFDVSTGGTLKLLFKPTATGAHPATLKITSGGADEVVVTLSGRGIPRPTLTSSGVTSLSFDEQIQNTTSAAQALTILGTDLLGEVAVSITGEDADYFSADTSLLDALQGGTLGITFTPKAERTYAATLIISSQSAQSLEIPLSGTGIPVPSFYVAPQTYTFANLIAGEESAAQTFMIGGEDLVDILSYTFTGDAAFTLDESAFSDSDGGALVVTFAPSSTGGYSATLRVSTTGADDDIVVSISGTGVAKPVLSSGDVEALVFTNQIVATTSSAQTLTVSGTNLLGVMGASITGPDAEHFSLDTSVFKPEAGGTLGISFTPDVAGAYTASLTLSSTRAAPVVIPLSGTGVAKPVVTSNVGALNFADRIVNMQSPVQEITVLGSNLWGEITAQVSGAGASAYTLDTSAFDPATGGTLGVRFAPSVPGSYPAVLTLSSPYGDDLVIALSGKGIPVPSISVTPTEFTFDSLISNEESQTQTFSISGENTIGDIAYTFTGDEAFALDGTDFERASGGELVVTFAPHSQGDFEATLTVSTAGAVKSVVHLSGTGVAKPTLASGGVASLAFTNQIVSMTSSAQTLTVSGAELQGAIAASITGADAEHFALDASAFSSESGGTLAVTFAPDVVGSYSAVLTLTSPKADTVTIALTGAGVLKPALTSDPSTLNFTDQIVHTTSAEQSVVISGFSLQGDIALELSGSGMGAYVVDTSSFDKTSGGALGISFTPNAAGAHPATLTVSTPNADDVVLTLNGTGVNKPVLASDEEALAFADQFLSSTSAAQTVSISGSDLQGEVTARITGEGASAFALDTSLFNTTSGGTLGVTFAPQGEGDFSATLTLTSENADTLEIPLTGKGIPVPSFSVTPTEYDFADLVFNEESQTQAFAIEGEDIVGGITYRFEGGDAFALDGSGFDASQGGELAVTFAPHSAGEFSATLTIATAGAEDVVVHITGTGVVKPALSSGGVTSLTFADQLVATTSASQTVTVSGSDLQGEIAASITGTSAEHFSLDASSFTPDAGGTLSVTFTPDVAGDYTATLTLASPKAESVVISLVGVGKPPPPATSGVLDNGLTWEVTDAGVLVIAGSGDVTAPSGSAVPWQEIASTITSVVVEAGVTAIGEGVFAGLDNATSVTIPNSVTTIGSGAFEGTGLTEVTIPGSVTEIGSGAFANTPLTDIIFTGNTPPSIAADAFDTIGSEVTVTRPPYTGDAYQAALSEVNGLSESKIIASPVASGSTDEGATWTLAENGELTISGDNVSLLDSGSMPWQANTDAITSVVIDDGITEIGSNVFAGLDNVTSVTIPNSVATIGSGAFEGTGLTEVTIPSSVTEIGSGAFANTNITDITFTGNTPPSIAADAFDTIGSEVTITRPPRTENAYTEVLSQLDGLTNGDLVAAPVNSGTTENGLSWVVTENGELIISGEGALTTPASGEQPWAGNADDITTVVIGDGITSIGDGVFKDLNIKDVFIPGSVAAIGSGAFDGNLKLDGIIFTGDTPPSLAGDALSGVNDEVVIYVPSTSNEYDDWSNAAGGIAEPAISNTPTLSAGGVTLLAFGNQTFAVSSAAKQLVIEGTDLVEPLEVSSTGLGVSAFAVDTATLSGGDTALNVVFTPGATKTYSATVTIRSSKVLPVTVRLTGTGTTASSDPGDDSGDDTGTGGGGGAGTGGTGTTGGTDDGGVADAGVIATATDAAANDPTLTSIGDATTPTTTGDATEESTDTVSRGGDTTREDAEETLETAAFLNSDTMLAALVVIGIVVLGGAFFFILAKKRRREKGEET